MSIIMFAEFCLYLFRINFQIDGWISLFYKIYKKTNERKWLGETVLLCFSKFN